MHKLFLIDDKVNVTKGIRSMIDWQLLGIEIIGQASNGKEALELMNSNIIGQR